MPWGKNAIQSPRILVEIGREDCSNVPEFSSKSWTKEWRVHRIRVNKFKKGQVRKSGE